MTQKKLVLAYSGGLDTSVAIKQLTAEQGYEVIAVAADLGEGKDLQVIHDKALKAGASKCKVIDAKELFAEQQLLPALWANVMYEGVYPLVSALSRPLIAKLVVDIAEEEQAQAVAHGCTAKGNDQVRFDVSFAALNPNLTIVAPAREFPIPREEAIAYANQHGIPLPINLNNPFSIDANLWGRSCECGVLEDPWQEPPEEAYGMTAPIASTPDDPAIVTLEFSQGKPIAINDQYMPFDQLIDKLNAIAGAHGVGRIDHIENRLVGIKTREIYEAPAAVTLIKAHQALEATTLTKDVAHFKPIIEQKFAQQVYDGYWYSPLTASLMSFLEQTQKVVTGTVRLKFHKGHAIVVGRKSPHSLYDLALATYDSQDQFYHDAAPGFVKLWGLPLEVYNKVNKGEG